MDDGIERAILTNEELLQETAAILNQQLSSSTSPETDIHSIRFCSDFLTPNHEANYPTDPLQIKGFDSLERPTHLDQPIDPRLEAENPTVNQSIFNPHNILDPFSPGSQSNLNSQVLTKPRRSAKRRKTNLKKHQNVRLHALDIPTCPAEQPEVCTQESLAVNEINIPTNNLEPASSSINGCRDEFSRSKFISVPSGEDESPHDDPTYQPDQNKTSLSDSAIIHDGLSTKQVTETAQVKSMFLYENPSSNLITERNIHPLLQTIQPSLQLFPSTQSPNQTDSQYAQTSRKTADPTKQASGSPKLPTCPTSYLGNTQVDVHGAGAGGGAAAVLAAAAAQQVSPTAVAIPLQDMIVTAQTEEVQEDGFGGKGSEEGGEPLPTSYNPDQFRSCNRIHWTKEEEELLLAEVEMNWERYDCMAHIMKRHGPRGSVSRAFADRTGVSLKDKAVNISSRWYRDGTEVSASRRRAFARFRPKQLRGKPRNELPGMACLSDPLTPSVPDTHNPPQHSSPCASSQ
ncbi:hypothetical protein PGT21_032302 [Puccinia graminis f. sp. tritici]|uniref:Myb-like domain-containing protein n=2 Tax=Puccinia graminis f. sp. tritici TaxID=56615 RepID=E3KRT1_PUCGT|nr:uncharacterized protein PGTG_12747 [Puccinia graminis f. sp. tritici CRL 75-36-700-3]EFP87006.1 hypothetical protein PGTG_12747 [Puccinia graminis f. sp. tritici CRL 75-36-700-3]KAA1101887.1 hypothetical protein PGT21_032302 [Puccinia graminis f. sp. tritici]